MKGVKFNLRNKFLVSLIPAVAAGILALGLIVSSRMSDTIISQQESSMQEIIKKTDVELDRWLDDRIRDTAIFSEIPAFKEATQGNLLPEANNLLKEFKNSSPVYEAIFLADTNGEIFLCSNDQSIGQQLSEMPLYKINVDKARQGVTWVGEAALSPSSGLMP